MNNRNSFDFSDETSYYDKKPRLEDLIPAVPSTSSSTTTTGPISNNPDDPAVGIDLGTTYSCVGVFRYGKVEIISNDQGNKTTPSYVAFTDEEIFVGDPAKAQATRNLNNTIYGVKRLMGRKFDDAGVQNDIKNWPFEVINEDNKPRIKIVLNGETKTFFPEAISSFILTKMKETAEAYLGKTVKKAVITVPAYFNDAQRQATKDAAAIAKLEVLRIINEPTAAAIAYGLERKDDGQRKVMIFDLGGGTFDVSILKIKGDFLEVISTAGDTHLGGEDFDDRMVDHFVEEFKRKHKQDISQNKKALRRLRTACEKAKRILSSSTMASVDLDSLHDGIDFYASITRARFEELNADLFKKTLEPVERAMQDAGLDKSQIQEIVLVGGSTRIPKVQKLIQDFFNGKELYKSINPDEAVAYGAAIQAAILNGDTSKEVQNVVLVDVTPLSLGISTGLIHQMSVVVKRNTIIPTVQSSVFTTVLDYQTSAKFNIYEGEHVYAPLNNLLGSFVLSGIPPLPKGVPSCDATFTIDADGLLNVTAVEKSTGSTNGITLTYNKNRLSQEEITRMINDAERFRAKLKKQKASSAAKNSLEAFCVNLKSTIQALKSNDILIQNDKDLIMRKCDEAMAWLHFNNSAEVGEFLQKQNELNVIFKTIITIAKNPNQKEQKFREMLGVTKDATIEQIEEGYRRAVLKYHPDKFFGDKEICQMMFRVAVNAQRYLISLVKGKSVL